MGTTSLPAGAWRAQRTQPEDNAYVQTFLDNPEIDEYFHHCFDERKRR
jgi:hypothetical protein